MSLSPGPDSAAAPDTSPDPVGGKLESLVAELNAPPPSGRTVTGPPTRRLADEEPVSRRHAAPLSDTEEPDGAAPPGHPEEFGAGGAADPAPEQGSSLAVQSPLPASSRTRTAQAPTLVRQQRKEPGLLTSASLPVGLLRDLERLQLEERAGGRQLRVGRYINDAIRALPPRPAEIARELAAHADELNIGRTSRDEGWVPVTTKALRIDAEVSALLDKIILAYYDKFDQRLTRNQLVGLALARTLRS
jgi:hypothetical protein